MCSNRWVTSGIIVYVIGVLTFWPGISRSESNLKLGVLEIHPSFKAAVTFDNNVCRTESKVCAVDSNGDGMITSPDEEKDGDDFVTIFSPGLALVLPMRDHRAEIEYRGDIARYSELEEEDYEDNTIRASLNLNFPGELSISLEDQWIDGHDPRGADQNLELDFYKKNTLMASAEQVFGARLAGKVYYTRYMVEFDESRNDFRNRSDNTLGLVVLYQVMPKTSFLAEYNFTTVSFDESGDPLNLSNPNAGLSRDSKINRGLIGLVYEFTVKSKGTVKVGVEDKKFEESARDKYTGLVASVELDHELNSRTLLEVDAESGSKESNLETEDFYVTINGGGSGDPSVYRKAIGPGRGQF